MRTLVIRVCDENGRVLDESDVGLIDAYDDCDELTVSIGRADLRGIRAHITRLGIGTAVNPANNGCGGHNETG